MLRGFSFRVEKGTTTVVVGASGSGKSVMLKHIVGLIRPDAGTVRVDGLDVPSLSTRQLYHLRRKIGYVFQFAALFDSMTIAENLAMGLTRLGGLSEAQITGRVAETLRLVDLAGYEARFPAELSGGQRKRAGLARAIADRPKYLLYDEPTRGLDPGTTTVIDRQMVKLQRELGVTRLVITHNMESAYRVGNRIGMLHEGRVLEEGTPEEIRRTHNPVVRGFIEGKPELMDQPEPGVSPLSLASGGSR